MRKLFYVLCTCSILFGGLGLGCTNGEAAQECQVFEDSEEGTTTVVCPDGSSSEIPHADDGTSCTVEDNDDGSTLISCDDGTEATVDDGAGCTVSETGDGEYTVACDDGTEGTITDGDDGAGCTVEDNDDGSATLSCDDGTEVVIEDGSGCTVEDHDDGTATVSCDDGSEADIGCTASTNDDGETLLTCGDEEIAVTADGDTCTIESLGDGEYELTCGDDSVVVAESGEHCTVDEDLEDGTATISCPDGTEVTVALNAPELVIEDVEVTPDRNEVVWEITIANDGLGDAGAFWLDVHLDAPSAPPLPTDSFGDIQQLVPSLAAGAQTTVEARKGPVDNDTYESWVIADVLLDYSDPDYHDIVDGPQTVDVDHQRADVDLWISDFDVYTDDDGLHWEATIHNDGPDDADQFDVSYVVNSSDPIGPGDVEDDPLTGQMVTVSSLAADSQVDIDGTIPEMRSVGAGEYDSWIFADTYEVNDDENAGTNPAGPETVTVSDDIEQGYEADLAVETFDVIGGDGEATFVATLTNHGPGPSGVFYADIFFDRSAPPAATDVGDEFKSYQPIDPGDTVGLFATYSMDDGTNDGWLDIDPGFTDDPDTINNLAGPVTYTVDDD